MEQLNGEAEPQEAKSLDPRLKERFRPKRVTTLEALRLIDRGPTAANILGKEVLAQLDAVEQPIRTN